MTPDEETQLRQLGQSLETVARWECLTGSIASGWQVASGSEIATDDAAAHPYAVGAAAWSAITAGISHLGCLRDSLFLHAGPDNVTARIHTHGQLTLVRGALENASMAAWLIEPDQHRDRVLRRVQQEWDEVKQLETVRSILGSQSSKPLPQRENELRAILTGVGAPSKQLKQRPGWGEIVSDIGSKLPHGGNAAHVVWKACSAIAHGEMRGMTAYLTKESQGAAAPGMQLIKVTGNIELMVAGGLFAWVTTKYALEIYKRRSDATMTI